MTTPLLNYRRFHRVFTCPLFSLSVSHWYKSDTKSCKNIVCIIPKKNIQSAVTRNYLRRIYKHASTNIINSNRTLLYVIFKYSKYKILVDNIKFATKYVHKNNEQVEVRELKKEK